MIGPRTGVQLQVAYIYLCNGDYKGKVCRITASRGRYNHQRNTIRFEDGHLIHNVARGSLKESRYYTYDKNFKLIRRILED